MGRSARAKVLRGDCLKHLRKLRANSVHALVTDPPAGIGFMGTAWDHHRGGREQWIAWLSEVMREALRVLKPGAHGLVWAIPRTSHWTATALEDAGFEVRDVVVHLFGTGFPKSLNLGDGWGTALKPAAEHWILVRKPLAGTVARNVAEHGTGALNIDGCRIGSGSDKGICAAYEVRTTQSGSMAGPLASRSGTDTSVGRWPANLLLSHAEDCTTPPEAGATCSTGCPVAVLDSQSGSGGSGSGKQKISTGRKSGEGTWSSSAGMQKSGAVNTGVRDFGDTGGASRFFYVAKASRRERGDGNRHPTVKPLQLMRYLVRLVTPPRGLVLDPFCGSGSTGVAALAEGFRFVGIELEAKSAAIARRRIRSALP